MNKKLILLLLLTATLNHLSAQNSHIKDRLTIKIGYQHYPWMGNDGNGAMRIPKNFYPALYVEANYRLYKFWEAGLDLGGSLYERVDYSGMGVGPRPYLCDVALKPMITYGINSKLKLLPLFFKRNFSFLDIYVSSKLGGIYFVDRIESRYARKLSQLDYGVYGGVAVRPFKRWGLYYEYGFGNYVKWKTGVSLKF
jgi:hypothetical protein